MGFWDFWVCGARAGFKVRGLQYHRVEGYVVLGLQGFRPQGLGRLWGYKVRSPKPKDVCSEVADGRPVLPRRRGRGPLAA